MNQAKPLKCAKKMLFQIYTSTYANTVVRPQTKVTKRFRVHEPVSSKARGPRVSKSLSYHRLRCLTYLEFNYLLEYLENAIIKFLSKKFKVHINKNNFSNSANCCYELEALIGKHIKFTV